MIDFYQKIFFTTHVGTSLTLLSRKKYHQIFFLKVHVHMVPTRPVMVPLYIIQKWKCLKCDKMWFNLEIFFVVFHKDYRISAVVTVPIHNHHSGK